MIKSMLLSVFSWLSTKDKVEMANKLLVVAATAKGGPLAGQAAQDMLPVIEKAIADKIKK
jgi:hypothetical protein